MTCDLMRGWAHAIGQCPRQLTGYALVIVYQLAVEML